MCYFGEGLHGPEVVAERVKEGVAYYFARCVP